MRGKSKNVTGKKGAADDNIRFLSEGNNGGGKRS